MLGKRLKDCRTGRAIPLREHPGDEGTVLEHSVVEIPANLIGM